MSDVINGQHDCVYRLSWDKLAYQLGPDNDTRAHMETIASSHGHGTLFEPVPAMVAIPKARLDAYAVLEQAAAELLEDGQLIAPHGEAVVLETVLYDRLDAALAALRATAGGGDMSATPEQLRAVADAMEHDNLNKPQYEQLMAALPEPYAEMMREMRYSHLSYVADAVALRLRLEAMLIEHETPFLVREENTAPHVPTVCYLCGERVGTPHHPACPHVANRAARADKELVAIVRDALGSV